MTTHPLCYVYLECVLALWRPLPFSKRGLQWMDGRTDKNRQTTAHKLSKEWSICDQSKGARKPSAYALQRGLMIHILGY